MPVHSVEVERLARCPRHCIGVLFEDDDLLVLNKPAGLVVRPGQAMPMAPWLMPCCIIVQSEPASAGGIVPSNKDTGGIMAWRPALAYRRLVLAIGEQWRRRCLAAAVMVAGQC